MEFHDHSFFRKFILYFLYLFVRLLWRVRKKFFFSVDKNSLSLFMFVRINLNFVNKIQFYLLKMRKISAWWIVFGRHIWRNISCYASALQSALLAISVVSRVKIFCIGFIQDASVKFSLLFSIMKVLSYKGRKNMFFRMWNYV